MAKLRCIVIGAGVSGLLITQKLKEAFGEDVEIRVFEKNADLGGTWLENRYPGKHPHYDHHWAWLSFKGCACDVPSHIYQFTFAPNPYWSRIFATSAEIHRYLKAFARHYDLEQHITFSCPVTRAEWNESRSVWSIEVADNTEHECDVLFNAGGILNNPCYPKLKNIESFSGPILHTAAWNADVDLSNKKIAVIGAGASSIQLLPALQPQVAHADIYIRTPSWITRPMGVSDGETNRDYSESEILRFEEDAEYFLQQRKRIEDYFNGMFRAFIRESPRQKDLRVKLTARMREMIPDEELQRHLIPEFEPGCRRLSPGEPYLETLQKNNVQPIFDPIEEITAGGIRSAGQERQVDVIILATGFDTSFRPRFPILGTGGRDLRDLWEHEAVSYFGLAVSGYPNFLMFLGPNTPIANGSLMGTLEATAEHFVRILGKKVRENVASFDVWPEVQEDFDRHTQDVMKNMVWTGTCRSWYKAGQNGKITALWPGSSLHYREVLAAGRFEDFQWKYHGNRFAYWKEGLSAMELHDDPKHRDLSFYMLQQPNLPRHLFLSDMPPSSDDETQVSTQMAVNGTKADCSLVTTIPVTTVHTGKHSIRGRLYSRLRGMLKI